MSEFLTDSFLTQLVAGALLAGIPLLFASLGETISERAGVLNIGLEGMMLVGAFVGFAVTHYAGFAWLGFGAAMVAGALVSLLMVVFCVRFGLDQIVIGIAITLAAEGVTSVVYWAAFADSRPILGSIQRVSIPYLSDLPVVGGRNADSGSLFSQPLIVYLLVGLVILTSWVLRSTSVGLSLRAAGEKPEAVDAAGVSVTATRSWAVLATGALGGLGGAYIAVVGAGSFQPLVTNGAGFIAIVIAMLGRGRPLWVVAGSLLFGISLSISDALQVAGVNIPVDVVLMLPFITVIAVLLLFARRAHLPAALAVPYVRGAR